MTTIRPARPRAGKLTATADYGLRISADIEKRMRRCRAPVRAAILKQLAEIAASAGTSKRRVKVAAQKEPPLRFYVYEGYRIAYQLDADTRRVVILDLQLLPVD
jgi:mRNA-degrading endonuclease RelE of RelBE toxin-antitoxin system